MPVHCISDYVYTSTIWSGSVSSCLYLLGGAGGKGTWGKLVEVYDDDGHTHDHRDPNYDSEEEVVCCVVGQVILPFYRDTMHSTDHAYTTHTLHTC